MKKQKQKIRRRKKSISNPQEPLYSSQQFSSLKKQIPNIRHIRHSYSTIPINSQTKLHHSKSHIVHHLAQNFRHKLSMDIAARQAIERQNVEKYNRMKLIEQQLQNINKQNQYKIEQLTKIQKNILKKLQKEIIRERQIEQKLIYSYKNALKQEEKINLTKEVKKIKDREDWIIIEQERKKLQMLNRSFQKKHLALGRDMTLEPKVRKKLGPPQDENKKNENNGKKQRKKKNAEELKKMGNNYLEHAKKVQAQKLKQNTKILDVCKKSIDYLPQIKTIIKKHGKDLSKPIKQEQILSPKLRRRRSNPTRIQKQ